MKRAQLPTCNSNVIETIPNGLRRVPVNPCHMCRTAATHVQLSFGHLGLLYTAFLLLRLRFILKGEHIVGEGEQNMQKEDMCSFWIASGNP